MQDLTRLYDRRTSIGAAFMMMEADHHGGEPELQHHHDAQNSWSGPSRALHIIDYIPQDVKPPGEYHRDKSVTLPDKKVFIQVAGASSSEVGSSVQTTTTAGRSQIRILGVLILLFAFVSYIVLLYMARRRRRKRNTMDNSLIFPYRTSMPPSTLPSSKRPRAQGMQPDQSFYGRVTYEHNNNGKEQEKELEYFDIWSYHVSNHRRNDTTTPMSETKPKSSFQESNDPTLQTSQRSSMDENSSTSIPGCCVTALDDASSSKSRLGSFRDDPSQKCAKDSDDLLATSNGNSHGDMSNDPHLVQRNESSVEPDDENESTAMEPVVDVNDTDSESDYFMRFI